MNQKIMAVDDSRMILRLVSSAIESIGYQPVTANHGKAALEMLDQVGSEVALVLLDWNMPEMDGMATLTAIKQHPRWSSIPVMMVTTESERESVIKAIQAGAQHYLTKPFNTQDLVTRILECLGQGS
jgi:two-component system, chemotaxis family, chemotaxis protein CheY